MRIEHLWAKVGTLVAFAAVCIGIFVYLFSAAGGNLRINAPYSFKATVPDAFQLVPQADVRRTGVKIGRVTDIKSSGKVATVTIEIKDRDQAPIYKDARLLVRTKTLVGENYIDLDPGTPAAGEVPKGAILPVRNAEEAVQLDQILSSFDEETRKSIRRNIQEIGTGVGSEQGKDLNRLFGAVRPTVDSGTKLLRIVDGQRAQVGQLINDTGTVLDALGRRDSDVRSLARSAKTTAVEVAARDQELRATLAELPSTLTQAQTSTAKLGSFSRRATPVLRDLRFATADLVPVVQDLGPTAASGRRLVSVLPSALKQLNPVLGDLKTFTAAARPAVPELDRFLRQLTPALQFLAPYSGEFGSFFANTGSMNGIRDAVGQIGRVHAQFGVESIGSLQPEAKKALDLLLESGLAQQSHSVGQNSYPVPGGIAKPERFAGSYRRVAGR